MDSMNSSSSVGLQDIQNAAERIKPYIFRTPLLNMRNTGNSLDVGLYIKPEMLQITGSFKPRGALNKILSIPAEVRKKGIITSSSGNHGQACAYIGQLMGIHATVVIPEDAPSLKINNARAMGAEVILWSRDYYERWDKIAEEVAQHGYNIVHPYEDHTVMAGQGTIGLEILEDLADVDTIIVPIGGGGLISGVSTAIKELKPNIRVIGVQAAACCVYYVSRQNGQPSSVIPLPTVADGLSCAQAGIKTYPIIEKNVDDIVIVDEEQILNAVRIIANEAKLLAEPSASVGIAALIAGKIKTAPQEKVCCVLTSGNWGVEKMGKIMEE